MASKDDIFKAAFDRHSAVLKKSIVLLSDIEKGGKILISALKKGNKILICGNGGSAADSQHFAAELTGRYKTERRALPAIALSTDTSALTAIGNDYGYERVFARQVEAHGKKGDVLVAFSTSGSSPNILAAISTARDHKMIVILMTGEKGTSARALADVSVVVPSTETARIQEVHELIYHAWCEFIDFHFAKNKAKNRGK